MNRTDRLYALVEELRAVAPRRRTARELAARYEVSVRTIERDISALQQSGVPIYADLGRAGGYTLDKRMSLPPLNFSPAEAVAVAVALGKMQGTPFDAVGAGALGKMLAAMSDESASAARALAGRVHLVETGEAPETPEYAGLVHQAILRQRVIEMSYADKAGVVTVRAVEPISLMWGGQGWYLVAWCRLREQSRAFRLDRIKAAELAGPAVPGPSRHIPDDLPPDCVVRAVSL